MDFLDPAKWRRHNITLLIGYALLGVAICMTALILLYQSFGYGIDDEGEVIQNGLVFAASTPNGANIFVNNEDTGFDTDKRLVLNEGSYILRLQRDGYGEWTRGAEVRGGSVSRYDYPFLFPAELETRTLKKYDAAPGMVTQSPDRRWVLAATANSIRNFDVYDLRTPNDPPLPLIMPESLLTPGTNQSYELVEWSNDNRHLLVKHMYGDTFEYVLIDRESPEESVNLSVLFGRSPSELLLIDKKFDQYYLFDRGTKVLARATLNEPTPVEYLKNVLEFKSYGKDTVLYITDDVKNKVGEAPTVAVKLTAGEQTYTLRRLPPGSDYLLEMAEYDGDSYMVAGSVADGNTYIFRNPLAQIKDNELGTASPFRLLTLHGANHVSFSQNTRFIMVQNASNFAVFDIENDDLYSYDVSVPFDAGQKHATWMDGHRLQFVSEGRLVVFDYDNTNRRSLMNVDVTHRPYYAPNYRQVFTISPQRDDPTRFRMAATWLLTAADR